MSSTYTPISFESMNSFLVMQGFTRVYRKGVEEVIFSKRIKCDRPLTCTVFTSICEDSSRDCGEDAIRVVRNTITDSGKIILVDGTKRVNRTSGWQSRLQERIDEALSRSVVVCSACGSLMGLREGRYGPFMGCCNFPTCRNILAITKYDDRGVPKGSLRPVLRG